MPKPHIYKFQGCGVFRAVDTFRKISIFREIVNFTFSRKKYQLAEKYRNPNFALSSKHTNYVKQKTTVNTRNFYAVQTLTQINLTTDDTIYIVLGIKNSINKLMRTIVL